MTRTALFVLTAVIAITSVGNAQERRSWDWRGTLAEGKTIQVKGVLGEIHVVRATGREARVHAVRHARNSDPMSVEFKVSESKDGVFICALYPTPYHARHENSCGNDDDEDHNMSLDNNDTHVDFTIEVPDHNNVIARTVVGDIDVQGVRGDVDASSVTGEVDVVAGGSVSAQSISGSIHVRMSAKKPDHDLDFKTISGNITLEVPSDFSADLRMKSQFGDVDSDFDIASERSRFGRNARGKIGAGGSMVYASTLSGTIYLKKN
ncbi:MAG TPA: DUF4097 family beta strand repeat-containing protein [Longimicrobiales bacterium]|nr:DUF4097 family beta strand repeat-containing protein [Longimicrobiales bacterium]